jgi:cell division protein FtsQ
VADDDITDHPTPTDDDAEVADDDGGRPLGRVVQLERPRSRRRRGGPGPDATRPDGRSLDDLPATTGRADHGPAFGPIPGDAADRDAPGHAGGALAGSPEGPHDAGTADASGAVPKVASLTTLRGRKGRRRSGGDTVTTPAENGDAEGGATPAQLHPRMRSRRIAVRRSEGLRRLRRLTWALAGLALVVDGVALAHTGFVDVDTFEVTGSTNTSAVAVQHASGVGRGDALLTLDEAGAERRIESLPWVAEADVVRQWPGTVRISVTERQPVAVLQVNDDPATPLALVDATGRVLQIGAHPDGLIAVTEVPAELTEGARVPAEARDALRIARAASQRMPGAIVSLTVDLVATLGSGGVVRFGSVDDLDTKLMALATVLARVDLDCLDSLNLAVADHPALTRSC